MKEFLTQIPKLLFTYEGRISRKEFWLGYLLIHSITAILAIIAIVTNHGFSCGIALFWAFFGNMIPGFAIVIKRLHDLNRSGCWIGLIVILGIIPLMGIVVLITLGSIPGTNEPNEYGPDPLQPD